MPGGRHAEPGPAPPLSGRVEVNDLDGGPGGRGSPEPDPRRRTPRRALSEAEVGDLSTIAVAARLLELVRSI